MLIERITVEPGLAVEVHAHDLAVRGRVTPAWSLVSHGLVEAGQREVVFTVLRRGNQTAQFPHSLIPYVGALRQFAHQGRVLDHLGISGYRAPGPFQIGAFVGVLCVEASPLEQVPLPPRTLCGLLLTPGELDMAQQTSPTRVLHRLGHLERHYPWPHWSDSTRASAYAEGDAATSLLVQLERAQLPEARAWLQGDELHLRVPAEAATPLAEVISAGRAIAVIPGPAPQQGAALTWHPKQADPEAIHDPAISQPKIGLNFIACAPDEGEVPALRLLEDGAALLLDMAGRQALAAALRSGTDYRAEGSGRGLTLTVRVGA